MSTNINQNALKTFIVKTLGAQHLTLNDAKKFDIDKETFDEAKVDENSYLDLDEIIEDSNLYEKFANMLITEREELAANDKEKEKEEQLAIKDKNNAGV